MDNMDLRTKIKKYATRPHLVIFYGFSKLLNFLRIARVKLFLKKVKLKGQVFFHQRTVFDGDGSVIIGDAVHIGYKLGGGYKGRVTELQARYPQSSIIIHSNVSFNNSNFICSANKIEIFEGCLIGANVLMMDFEAHGIHCSKRGEVGEIGSIIIEKNVWIGSNVIILKNVVIGEGSIIAAGSVVTRGHYPPNSILGGNPAKIIRSIEV